MVALSLALATLIAPFGPARQLHGTHRVPAAAPVAYVTYHFDNLRTGWNPFETALNWATVASPSFGLRTSLPTDGNVYAQPLYVPGVAFPGGGMHNVLVVATEYDSVYAFDADTYATLWHTTFVNLRMGVTPMPSSSVSCSQIAPWVGVSSTPVIDPATGAIYLVAKTVRGSGQSATFHNTLHALSLTSGLDLLPPVEIAGSVRLSDGSLAKFDPHWQVNRPGLVLTNGTVYVGFGSSCDINANFVHGWLFGYSASSLKRTHLFNTSTDVTSYFLDSIWQSTYAIAADATGDLFFATGNGAFDANLSGHNYGDTVLRMHPKLSVVDYFTPYNQQILSQNDADLGSGGVMLLPVQPGAHPHLAVEAGKADAIYLLDRDNLGKYTPGGPDKVLYEVPFSQPGVWGGPAYFASGAGKFVYYALTGDALKAYRLSLGPSPSLTLASASSNAFPGEGGTIPSVSSNGTTPKTGIVWATTRPNNISSEPIVLYAYEASNLSHLLFSASVGFWQNAGGAPFLTPTVANGKVFVGGASAVSIYGL
jgi:hypothetical protein